MPNGSKELFVFEDNQYVNFNPLTLLRPIYFLRPGIRSLYEVISDNFPEYNTNLFCRENLSGLVVENTSCSVNKTKFPEIAETILINGRLKANRNLFEALQKADTDVLILSKGELVGAKIFGGLTEDEMSLLVKMSFDELIEKMKKRAEVMEIEIGFYNYLWDIVNDIERAIENDVTYLKNSKKFSESFITGAGKDISMAFPGVVFINGENIMISRDARILPGAVLNGSDGPIFIDNDVFIEPHTYLIGPVYVGPKSILVGGKITGCSIGPVCRVGGEVEESVIQGYSNKYHAGFLGHAYVGEWVNFGAMTTNSDLRNDYKNVKVSINGEVIDTGFLKIGSFIGDFTKTAIGTLLNTGINIGIACNILGKGLVVDKEIPSFTWYAEGRMHEYRLSKALVTIEKSMTRRKVELGQPMKDNLELISNRRLVHDNKNE
ncbi:MAG: hypothetical protein GY865_19080 [candidate division Zixibacteria bacterium]|nr:hypothetical protein [candidate division Zixibacteria bacterium]